MELKKTELGRTAFKDKSRDFTPAQRSAYVMFDGARSTQTVISFAAGLGFGEADVQHLVGLGFLEAAESGAAAPTKAAKPPVAVAAKPINSVDAPQAPQTSDGVFNTHECYKVAYPEALKLAAGLGMRGFLLNLAVERATSYEDLVAVAPKLREAVGEAKFGALKAALSLY